MGKHGWRCHVAAEAIRRAGPTPFTAWRIAFFFFAWMDACFHGVVGVGVWPGICLTGILEDFSRKERSLKITFAGSVLNLNLGDVMSTRKKIDKHHMFKVLWYAVKNYRTLIFVLHRRAGRLRGDVRRHPVHLLAVPGCDISGMTGSWGNFG